MMKCLIETSLNYLVLVGLVADNESAKCAFATLGVTFSQDKCKINLISPTLHYHQRLGGHGIGEERKCRPKGDNEERKLGVF